MKRRQNTHQHTRVQHLWGLLSAGCCLVTEGPVGILQFRMYHDNTTNSLVL